MTDPSNTPPQDPGATAAPDVPPAPPAQPYDAPAYDPSPYVAPAAPAYDTFTSSAASDQPPAAPPYTPPAYPGSPYAGGSPYGVPTAPPYGASYPVQTTPGAPPVAPYAYGGYVARKTNGLAIASLILSIVGFIWILPFVGSLAGAIMGHVSLGQIKRTGDGGRGMALAGIIVGWAGVALIVLGVLFVLIVVWGSSASSMRYRA